MKNVNLSDKNLRLTQFKKLTFAKNKPLGRRLDGIASHPVRELIRAQNWAITSWYLGSLSDCLYYLEQAECYEFPFWTHTTQDLINQLLEHESN